METPMAKILIVDDSLAHLHSLKSIVEDDGHEVLTAQDWERGLDAARSQHPDLILLDIIMPGMNGFQVNRKLRNTAGTQKIPIIFVSIKNQESDIAWGMRQGAKAYITKPVNKKELLSAIGETLAA
jgi:twitching motility two-component system response regulator PilH